MKRQFFVSDAVKEIAKKALAGQSEVSIYHSIDNKAVDEVAMALSKFIEKRQKANSIPHEIFIEKISI